MSSLARSAAAFAALACASACGGDRAPSASSVPNGPSAAGSGDMRSNATTDQTPTATFTEVYALLFPRSSPGQCEMCHALPAHDIVNGMLETGMSPMDAYAALVDKPSRSSRCMSMPLVKPGDPDMSLFYLKLTASPPCGLRMPNGGAALTESQLSVVRSWIAAGAKND